MYVCMLYHTQNLHIILKCTLNNFIISTPPLLAGRVGLESMMKRKKMLLLGNKNTIYPLSYSLTKINQNLPNTRTSCNTASRTLPPIPRMYCTTARTAT